MPALLRPSPETRSGGSRTGRGSHMRGGWRGGRSLRSPGPAGGCDGDRRRPGRSPHSRFPVSQLPQPGGRGGVAVTLETIYFRRAVTSVSFMHTSLPSSFLSPFSGLRLWKAARLWYRVVFRWVFIFFVLFRFVCSVSQEPAEACFWNALSWVSPPNGGSRIAVRGTDLCAAPRGPFRPWQAWCTISMLVWKKNLF